MALLISANAAYGQAVFGNIFGTVTDPSGAAVPGAEVTIEDVQRGARYTTATNASGNFTRTNLQAGEYRVMIQAGGFKTFIQDNVTLGVDQAVRVDAVLELGEVAEQITVTEAPPLLKSDRADVSTALNERQVTELPALDRNLTQLQLLLPGSQKMTWQHASSENPQQGLQINTNGQLFGNNSFLLDGTDNNDPLLGIIVINPNLESIEEFKFTSSNYDAEFGQAGGAILQVTTKSGTNEFHGAAFHFLRNDNTNARNSFTEPEDASPLAWNQFGAAAGGPIIKNKLFIFGDYQGTRRRTGAGVQTTVPTPAFRNGDFSALLGDQIGTEMARTTEGMMVPLREGMIFDPASGNFDGTGREVFSHNGQLNVIAPDRISDVTRNYLNLLPQPNFGGAGLINNNFIGSGSEVFDSDQWDVRVDNNVNNNLRWFLRFTQADFRKSSPTAFGNVAGGPALSGLGFGGVSDTLNNSIASGGTYTVSPTVVTEFRFGWTRYAVDVLPGDFGLTTAQDFGIPGINMGDDFTSGSPALFINGDGGFNMGFALGVNSCNCPLKQRENTFQWVNNWTMVKGNHTTKWGVDYRYAKNLRVPSDAHRAGEITFQPSLTSLSGAPGTGNGVASFLLGAPSGFRRNVSETFDAGDRQNRLFLFWQDSWRVTPKLSLNFGVRWDTFFPQTPSDPGKNANFDFDTGEMIIAGIGPIGDDSGIDADLNNFAPRLGIAYQLDDKTVIRTGWGRSYFIGFFGNNFGGTLALQWPILAVQSLTTPNPFQPTGAFQRLSGGPPLPPLPAAPDTGRLAVPDGISVTGIPFDNRIPYTDFWNFTIQRQLGANSAVEVAYVGNVGRKLNHNLNVNATQPAQSPDDPFNPRRVFFNRFGLSQPINLRCDCVNSSYNGLQVKFEKRLSQGYQITSSFTFSKSLNFGEFGNTDPFDVDLDKGLATFDRAAVFTLGHLWELPFARNSQGLARKIFHGWTFNGVTSAQSGAPFTAVLSNNASLNRDIGLRPDRIADPNAGQDRNRWFDASAFAVPAPLRFGTESRNNLRGPGLFAADLSVFKNIEFGETTKLQIRIEAFNAFNTTNLSPFVNGAVDTGNAGQISDVAIPMRQFQWGLRYTW